MSDDTKWKIIDRNDDTGWISIEHEEWAPDTTYREVKAVYGSREGWKRFASGNPVVDFTEALQWLHDEYGEDVEINFLSNVSNFCMDSKVSGPHIRKLRKEVEKRQQKKRSN